jgi:ATP-dependent DNA helicase RecQ
VEVKQNEKSQLLEFLRSEHSGDSGIIYCMTRKKVEEVARLVEDGMPKYRVHKMLGISRSAVYDYLRDHNHRAEK